MKATLLTLGLLIGIWSNPASAGPFDIPHHAPDHGRAAREIPPGLQIHRLGPDWRLPAVLPSAIQLRIEAHRTHDPLAVTSPVPHSEPRLRMDSPRALTVVSGIPEPSAATLFGVGLLLAIQAIPRN